MLTFVVPVRHQDSVSDWGKVNAYLRATFASIAAQIHPDWRAVVVANRGAALPPLPDRFTELRVEFPCPVLPGADRPKEELYNAIRDDKGGRVWAGLKTVEPRGHVMVVDYDDFVSRRLAATAAAAPDAAGWYVADGYLYDGSDIVMKRRQFDELCGTSLIVHARHFYPGAGADERHFVRHIHGSHKFIKKILREQGDPLIPLPYPGAMYRVGHAQASSGSAGLRQHLSPGQLLRHPWDGVRRISRLRRLDAALQQEFLAA
ncbi:galactosyl transferase [Rubrivivax gelatinosus]|uniref:Galactosyl transferase n=1 Tax=Rubrivivax gelatinosus TaxID=28068 RepID=A0ABS1DSZ8_RUBGE|nr:galactosyl transferase [Rubrivivax gelatinosus]MBK1713083.1 hypothetical protein [Rubrivivax gelatinosus]